MKIRLGDICSFQSGGTPSRSNTAYFSGEIPWITTTGLNGSIIDENAAVEWITPKAIAESAAKIVPKGSIMVGTRVGVGKVAINSVDMSTSQDIISMLDIDEATWDKSYICNFILSRKDYLNSQARGATIKGIKIDVLAELPLPYVCIAKQRQISEILATCKAIIRIRARQLTELDTLVKARFVEMFGNPVVNDKGWKQQPMNTVAPADTAKEIGGMVWLLNLDMIEAQTGRIIDYLFVDSSEIGTSTCAFDTGNVLYSKLRPYLNKVVVPEREGFCTTELVPLRPCRDLDRQFLAYLLRSDAFVSFINEKVAGAKMPRVSMGVFREFLCIMPPIEMQKQFSTFVSQVDKSKAVVQKALDEAQTLFDSLMQQYFG